MEFLLWHRDSAKNLEKWLASLKTELRSALDFSFESLIPLEQYLLEIYPDSSAVRKFQNREVVDAVCTYIGEVYLRSDLDLAWGAPEDEFTIAEGVYQHFWHVKGLESGVSSLHPWMQLPYALRQRIGGTLYESIKIKYERSKANLLAPKEAPAKTVPGRGGYSYQYMAFIDSARYSTARLSQSLTKYIVDNNLKWRCEYFSPEYLYVQLAEDYCFHFWFDGRDHVIVEAKEIASNPSSRGVSERLSLCPRRIDIWADEDTDGSYKDAYDALLAHVAKNKNLIFYSIEQGAVVKPKK